MRALSLCLPTIWSGLGIFLSVAAAGIQNAPTTETWQRDLPPGVVLKNSVDGSPEQMRAISQKLGGRIQRLNNSQIQVQGRPIKVNVITAVDEQNARAVYEAIAKLKSPPFLLQKGATVIEYVGDDIDASLATKTSYELGFVAKPPRVRYRVVAELATVEEMDYRVANQLFNQLLAVQSGNKPQATEPIQALAQKMKFGDQLLMRNMSSDETSTTVSLQPTPSKTRTEPGTTTYEFTKLPRRHDIPYVTVTWETTVNASGFVPEETPARSELTAATPFWPSNDPQVIALAEKITAGCGDDSAKVQAILEWLAPGRNLKYAGETGSRWGVQQVLKQGYGHCWDFSDCFITLARAAGVPCRQVGGWLYGSSGHVWAEYYQSGPGPGQTEPGWQQVDPTGGGKLTCGIYHIPYFTSETGAMPILYVALPTIEMVNEK